MSILFTGNSNSNASVPANNLVIGTNQFTIEWWQYQTDSRAFPRIFAVGNYPSTQFGVSIEGGTFYFWTGGSFNAFGSVTPFKNQWVHFAITRAASNQVRVFKNGSQISTTRTISTNLTQSLAFRLANETTTSDDASFGGNITNFRIVIGTAVYTSNFTVPTSPLTAISGTALLLLASSSGSLLTDSSSSPKSVTGSNVTWSSDSPFPAPAPASAIGWTTTSTLSLRNGIVFNDMIVGTLLSGLVATINDLETSALNTNTLRVDGIVEVDERLTTGRLQVDVSDAVRSGIVSSYSTLGSLAYVNDAFVLTNGDRFGVIQVTGSYLTFLYTKPADSTIYSYNLIAFN